MKTGTGRWREWLFWTGLRGLWQRFRQDRGDLSGEIRRRFWLRLGLGALFALAVTFAVTKLGQWAAPRGLNAWDEGLLRWLVEDVPLFTYYTATIFESPGNLAMTVPLLVLTLIIAVRRGAPLVAMGYLAGYIVIRPLIYFGWWIWNRARPDFVAGGAASPPVHSYPSGHAVLSMFMYGFLVWLWCRSTESASERSLAVFCGALFIALIGYARLRLGTHWPSDILAGFLIGGAWLGWVILAIRAGDSGGRAAPRAADDKAK